MDDREYSQIREITEDNTKLTVINLEWVLPVSFDHTPYILVDADGKAIGTLAIQEKHGNYVGTVFLDHHTPERLDIEVDAEHMHLLLNGTVEDSVFQGTVVLRKKGRES